MPVLHIGVLGGTFDPIHLGHLGAADAVRHARSLDLVVFVPTGRPWHRGEIPGIDVSATEVRRRVARGEAIADLVPTPVAQYIAEHGLYRSGGG